MIETKPDIADIVEAHGGELKQRGGKLWGRCLFHSEKTASFKVDTDRQEFYCFGCHEHGDVITFIQKLKGIPFKDAVRYLGISTGKPSPEHLRQIERTRRKRQALKEFNLWLTEYHSELCLLYRSLQAAKSKVKTEADLNAIADFYHEESEWLRRLEMLESGTDEEKYQLWRTRECKPSI